MQIAYVIFDGFTALDITGPHEVLHRVPGAESVFVAENVGQIHNESGTIAIVAERSLDEVGAPDVVVVSGGRGIRRLLAHEPLLAWLRQVHEATQWTTAVCTGSLLLAAAGLLDDAPAATHWRAREELAALGARPVPERVVQHGKIITAAGVSSGIDMALHLVALMRGKQAAQAIQLQIEYDPEPPFAAGSPEKAPAEIVQALAKSPQPPTAA